MHNIHFHRCLFSFSLSLLPLPLLFFFFVYSTSLAIRLNPTARGFRGYSSKFKLSSKWFFSINASWRTPTSCLAWIDLSLSFLHFSLPVTYPFLPVPSSFVWRVIKLATSDGGFNWFRSVRVECTRTRRVALFCRYISKWYIMLRIFPRELVGHETRNISKCT